MDKNTAPAKGKKKKGPIRTEAVVPFVIVCAVVALYFTLFFDGHLRRGIEWAGSRVNGAEVNVGSLKTNFWKASLRMGDIEVTDRAKPAQNKVQVGKIQFGMLWDALLRGKFVVDLASVMDIQMGTPRKQPGEVYPDETKSKALEILRSQITGTVLEDIGRMFEGFDPRQQLKDIGANLKSSARIQELRNSLTEKEKAWTGALNAIPGNGDIAALQQRINSIQISGGKNPAEIQAQITQVTGIISELDQKVKAVETQANALSGDVNSFGKSVGEIDDVMKKDVQDLEKRIQLPKLDSKSLAKELFGPKVVSQVARVEEFVAKSRELMPTKAAKKDNAEPLARPRKTGKLYQFGRPNSYPLFWIKKAEFTSRMENTPLGGNVSGQLIDATSSQAQLGRPTRLELKGDFPKSGFTGIQLLATLDHTKDVAVENLKLAVASFPVDEQELSKSEAVTFAIQKAIGTAGLEGTLKGEALQLRLNTTFHEVDYKIAAKSKLLESSLQAIVKDIPTVAMQADITGTFKELALSISSNLAAALEQGFQKQLQAKVAQARAQIQGLVNEQIGKQKAELTGRYQDLRGKVTGQIDEKRKRVEDLKGQANAKLAAAKSQLTSPKLPDALRKKLPF